jgi:hypothetical protein
MQGTGSTNKAGSKESASAGVEGIFERLLQEGRTPWMKQKIRKIRFSQKENKTQKKQETARQRRQRKQSLSKQGIRKRKVYQKPRKQAPKRY